MKNKFRLAISMVLILIILSMNGISAATNAAGTIAGDRSAAIHCGHTHDQFSEKRKIVYVDSVDEILNYSLSDIESSIFVIDEMRTEFNVAQDMGRKYQNQIRSLPLLWCSDLRLYDENG